MINLQSTEIPSLCVIGFVMVRTAAGPSGVLTDILLKPVSMLACMP